MARIKDIEYNVTDWTLANTGPRMRAFLKHTHRTHMAAAVFLGVSVTSISRWANGHYIPDFRTRRTIQNILEMEERSGTR